MNGYECGRCGQAPCVCKEIERNYRIADGKEVIETAWHVLATTPKWKIRIIRIFWPEILHVIEVMKEYYRIL